MGLTADLAAYLTQKTAPLSVNYGRSLRFAGSELPSPTRTRIPTRHGRVRCDIYRDGRVGGPAPPAYVHLHGGAFVMRYPKMDDFFARFISATTGATVVNVDYDVAPQVRFPVAQHQAHDVAAWVAKNGHQLDVDGSRVAIGGFSAGGNLAASAALQARNMGSFQPALQVLAVPAVDVAGDIDDKPSVGPHPMITPRTLRLVRGTYFRDVAARRDPYASPLRAPDLSDLAPALVLTAEHDLLRAEGDAYARRLAEAGVEVDHHVIAGVDHYFLDGDRDQARGVLDLVAQRMAATLA